MKGLQLIAFILISNLLSSQTVTYFWNNKLCSYKSSYESTLYSKKQIEDCYKITFEDWKLTNIFLNRYVTNYFDTLEIIYNKKKATINFLNLPQSDYWLNRKNNYITDLDEMYNLTVIFNKSFTKPEILKEFHYEDSCLKKHADALIFGADSLLKDWHDLVVEKSKHNGIVKGEYENELNSRDKFLYAQNFVSVYGWWNCAIKYLSINKRENDWDYKNEQFKNLFIKNELIYCD